MVESVRYRGGTNEGYCGDSGIDYWFMSGSDVRSDTNSIKWWVDRLPTDSYKVTCDPFDPGALVASYPNVGRYYPLQVRIKWDHVDSHNNAFSFTTLDCWRIDTSLVNRYGDSC